MLQRRHQNSQRAKVSRTCAAHRQNVRGYACVGCGHRGSPENPIEAAHYRLGTGGAMGMKPSDRWVYPACRECHRRQHDIGERTWWREIGKDPVAVCNELVRRSPRRAELEAMP